MQEGTRSKQYYVGWWGIAVEAEAQWCHLFEVFKIPGIVHALTSWNIMPHREGILARALSHTW